MGRKRRRSNGAATSGEEAKSESVVAAPSKPVPTASSADNKKQRLDDGKSVKQAKPLKLKLIKAPGASVSKSAPAVGSSKSVGTNASSDTAAAGEGKKKKKKNKKGKEGASDAPAASTPAGKAKPADTSAIDDLFASLKTAKKEQARADEQKKKDEAKAAQRAQQEMQQLQAHIKKLEAQNTNSIGQVGVNPDPRPVRYDEDGLPIYTEDSLHIGKGGDTADCPFDCWCCF